MDREFHKNAILVGYVDSMCLVCEAHLMGPDAACRHIADPLHSTNLQTAQILPNFKDDYILKVKQRYYCVYCNAVFPTTSKVSLHVADAAHKARRGAQLLRAKGTGVVYHDQLLDGAAWHGLTDGMCALCNTEVEDETAHKSESTHIFNLAKNKVEFGLKDIYRKVDDSTFQCMTCNLVLSLQVLNSHFEELEHKNVLLKCAKAYLDFKQNNNVSSTSIEGENDTKYDKDVNHCNSSINSKSSSEGFNSAGCSGDESCDDVVKTKCEHTKENKTKILELVSTFEKNEVNIDFESETAICKKCLRRVDFNCEIIKDHIDEHRRNPRKRDVGYVPYQCEVDMKVGSELERGDNERVVPAIEDVEKNTPEFEVNQNVLRDAPTSEETPPTVDDRSATASVDNPEIYAKRNFITYNKNNKQAYCRLCGVRMPNHMESLKEHVTGKAHNKQKQKNLAKKLSKDFCNDIYNVVNAFTKVVVVNKKFCMDMLSFNLITKAGGRPRCQLCEANIFDSQIELHCKSYIHQQALLQTPVITNYDTEFVREVRPGVFHCAFCNLMESSEELLLVHFESSEHRQKKAEFKYLLQRHLPGIREHQRNVLFHQMFLRDILQNSHFRMPFF